MIANTELFSHNGLEVVMRKKISIITSSLLMLLFTCMVSNAQTKTVSDIEKAPTYEVGGQLFYFHGDDDLGFGWGAGGRFTYNLNNHIALDNEVNFFLPDEGPPYATQGLFGIKAGKRFKHVGIFAKARPGFQTNFVVNGRDETKFAMDVGAVAEVYPNRHLVLRFDASDVIIPFGNNVVGRGIFAERHGTTHNLQFSLGVGVRF